MAGAIFILLSIPFILQLVPPNHWSGFRVEKTLSDERVWYAANRVMGYDLLIAGVVILATTIATAIYLRGNRRLANRLNLAVFILSLAVAAAHSFWALTRM
ncbi:MAG TPA: SdpI family protein [Blastocatellia bacterium]|nr:SdpI family protein [Blastocatellia bacterium]